MSFAVSWVPELLSTIWDFSLSLSSFNFNPENCVAGKQRDPYDTRSDVHADPADHAEPLRGPTADGTATPTAAAATATPAAASVHSTGTAVVAAAAAAAAT